jgi:hypothetical protein
MAIAIIMAIVATTMYVIRSLVVARFNGAVVAVGVRVATGADPTDNAVAAPELP